MKLSAVVVLYLPEMDKVIANIQSYIAEVDALLVFQNSEGTELRNRLTLKLQAEDLQKLIFLGNGQNVGIAAAMNAGVTWALKHHYTHLLTLDQDSYFEAGYLKSYKEQISTNKDSSIGVFGVNPFCHRSAEYFRSSSLLEVPDTISSGSVIPLQVFEKCGLFNEELFIDAVDYEFCYRIKKSADYKTVISTSTLMHHEVGYPERTIFGFSTVNYSAFRTYFILRNQIAIWKQYPDMFQGKYKITLIKSHIFLRCIKIILAETDKVRKLRAIFTGIIHGLKGRTGYYKIQ